MATTKASRRGRPPAGVSKTGQPEKTSEYPRLLIVMRPDTRKLLDGIAAVQSRPAWRIVDDAIAAYLGGLPPEDRKLIDALAKRPANR